MCFVHFQLKDVAAKRTIRTLTPRTSLSAGATQRQHLIVAICSSMHPLCPWISRRKVAPATTPNAHFRKNQSQFFSLEVDYPEIHFPEQRNFAYCRRTCTGHGFKIGALALWSGSPTQIQLALWVCGKKSSTLERKRARAHQLGGHNKLRQSEEVSFPTLLGGRYSMCTELRRIRAYFTQ